MIVGQMSDTLRHRILIVDDDLQISSGLEALLSDDWDVRVANDGRNAVIAFGEFSPDVVLLDVQLPDTTGIDLLHQFKMYAEATAVIMMSGVHSLDRVIESMKLGAETFLQKPFDYGSLEAVLQQVQRMLVTRRELVALRRNEAAQLERLPGISPSITHLNDILTNVARVPSPVPGGSTLIVRAPRRRSSISTARDCRRNCWSRSCSDTSAARSRMR